jgi:drug/metabolite transporter (DMT)-like permease
MSTTVTELESAKKSINPPRAQSTRWVPLAFAAVYILWGSTYLGIRIAIESFPPLAMAGIRHMLVGLILYPILRWKTGIRPTPANWRTACVTGGAAGTLRHCRPAGRHRLPLAGHR